MTESPFLPNTKLQYAWDSTSLSWLKECPRKYQYHMIEGWRSKGESVHLIFGIWFHQGLENYDRGRSEGKGHEDALADVIHQLLKETWVDNVPWTSDHPLKTRENLIRAVIWYVEHFKEDNATTLQLANGKPAVELSFKIPLDFGPEPTIKYDPQYAGSPKENIRWGQSYILCGHLDRVVDFSGGQYVMDRKTTTTTPSSYYFDQYEPDNQMTIYTIAGKVAFGTPVRGVIIDAVQIAVGFTRFVRGMTYRTPAQIEEWLKDLQWWLRQAEGFAEADYWPMNDKSCHKYGGCPFRKVCSKDPSVRPNFLESDFERTPWNPLEER